MDANIKTAGIILVDILQYMCTLVIQNKLHLHMDSSWSNLTAV